MTVLWREDFVIGPSGAVVSTSNTVFEEVEGGFGGDAFVVDDVSGVVWEGDFAIHRDGDDGTRNLNTTEPAAFFVPDKAITYNVRHYTESGQPNVEQPSGTLNIQSTPGPTRRFVAITHRPASSSAPGFRLSASSQGSIHLGTFPADMWYRMQIEVNPTQFVGRIFDNVGALLATGTLVNNFYSTGRAVEELQLEVYHGYFDEVTVEGPGGGPIPARLYPTDHPYRNSPRIYPPSRSRLGGIKPTGYL